MKPNHFKWNAVNVVAVSAIVALSACGDKTLDLGRERSTPPPPPVVDGPRYATREDLAAEGSAGPGVPTVMASHQYGTLSLALDETRVYWATEGCPETLPGQHPHECAVVRSCAKDDCAATLITYAYLQGPGYWQRASHLAVNKTNKEAPARWPWTRRTCIGRRSASIGRRRASSTAP